MKQLFLKKGNVYLEDVPAPVLESNNILVKVYYSFISSGTELAAISESEKNLIERFAQNSNKNTNKIFGAVKSDGPIGAFALIKNRLNAVSSLGYACSGKVIAIGADVQRFKVGDYVACAGANIANHAEYISVPVKLATKVLNKNNLKQASLTTIGAIAMQGVRRANLALGETVVVLGLGLIGQITAQLCKLAGCKVFGIDIEPSRLETARQNGIDFVLDANSAVADQINFFTNHKGVDATIITATGDSGIINSAMQYTRRKGRVVLVGNVDINFDRNPFYSKEIDFLISCSYGPGRYDNDYENKNIDYPYSYVRWTENRNMELFVDFLENKKLKLDFLIDQEFDINQPESAYTYLDKQKGLGALFAFGQDLSLDILNEIKNYKNLDTQNLSVIKYLPPKNKIQVGFVGAGGFAKVKLLPILFKNRYAKLHTLIDKDNANLLTVAKTYNAKKIGNIAQKAFNDEDINMVVIATPHKYHFEQSLEALKNGKAVFVEKPAVVNFEQLYKLEQFFKLNPDIYYTVDFNRSFAPFNLIIKNVLSNRTNPLMINYRINAGYIAQDHWVNDKENGGRIIGEACHIFDLFGFLTDASPISVSVQSINGNHDSSINTDNFVATVLMSDGSCCNLIYSSLGNHDMGKENMEILFDGKSIVMQDYKVLKGFGLPASFNRTDKYPDKGHQYIFDEFVFNARIANSKQLINLKRIIDTSKLALTVDKLVRKNGGFEVFEN
ncbi:MAG: Oxidoreductase, NAD-binding domain protein [candidate division TM6 bacterium GW2011_GWF2_28_16]|nr:MAG: Oxidoreductase, NAD-binding domain protein [candidate division TM6 bacterium GW2011_GWF2_28_16]